MAGTFSKLYTDKPFPTEIQKFIKSNYQIYESVGLNKTGKVLFTGYYEPILHGRLNRSDEYRFPVYGRPNDLLTIDLSLFSSRWQGEKIIARYSD
ncbi:murein transglycosylase, partial [Desulfobacteraceae bacterium SEEP-SAG9]